MWIAPALGVIPARYASSRFPGKPLALIAGKPMLQHVYERASRSRHVSPLIIATDDERIAAAARGFGALVRLTRSDHPSGTDRVAEVAAQERAEIVVNIQGDEPFIEARMIDDLVAAIAGNPESCMSTLRRRIETDAELENPNVVKVITDHRDRAIYFSRFPIPYVRGRSCEHFKHIGLYAYRRDFLLAYSRLAVGPLERAECLEQLRALENGYVIKVATTEFQSLGVDTPADLEAANARAAAVSGSWLRAPDGAS